MERTELTVRSMIFSPLLLLWQGQHLYVSDWISSVVSPLVILGICCQILCCKNTNNGAFSCLAMQKGKEDASRHRCQRIYVSDRISCSVRPVACTMALTVTFTSA